MTITRSILLVLVLTSRISCQVSKVITSSSVLSSFSTSLIPMATPTVPATTSQPTTTQLTTSAPNVCSRNPCQNGGTCKPSVSNIAQCTCINGYEGNLCQLRTRSFVIITTFVSARVNGQLLTTVTRTSALRNPRSSAFIGLCAVIRAMIRKAIPNVLRVHCLSFRAGSIISEYTFELPSTSNETDANVEKMITNQIQSDNFTVTNNQSSFQVKNSSQLVSVQDYDECSKNINGFCDGSAMCRNLKFTYDCICTDGKIMQGNKCISPPTVSDNEMLAVYITIGVLCGLIFLLFLLLLVICLRRKRRRGVYETAKPRLLRGGLRAKVPQPVAVDDRDGIDWDLYRTSVEGVS